jgi:hypothetical protein
MCSACAQVWPKVTRTDTTIDCFGVQCDVPKTTCCVSAEGIPSCMSQCVDSLAHFDCFDDTECAGARGNATVTGTCCAQTRSTSTPPPTFDAGPPSPPAIESTSCIYAPDQCSGSDRVCASVGTICFSSSMVCERVTVGDASMPFGVCH